MNRKHLAKNAGRAVLPGQMWTSPGGFTRYRVMAVAEGWVMLRKHGGGPFLVTVPELDAGYKLLSVPSVSTSSKNY